MSWRHICAIVWLACLVQPGVGQQGASDVSGDVVWTKNTVLVNTKDSSQLQLRIVLAENGRLHRVEVDVLVQSDAAVLLLSQDEATLPGGEPPILHAKVVLPMQRISQLTFGVDLDWFLVPAEIKIYAQAAAMASSGQILASDIAQLGVVRETDPGAKAIETMYDGPPIEIPSGLAACTRVPPLPCTYALQVSVTVRSSDWDLTHHLTCLDERGSRVFLILKKPGPGEGLFDIVETHTVWVQLGEGIRADVRVYVAVTESWNPPASSLEFQHAKMH